MIELVSVTKRFDDFTALEDVSFELDPKEFTFLTGPSGSGKTTLIKMLIREIIPTEGQVIVDSEDITKLKRHNIYNLRRKIGVIFQDFRLIEDKTAYENVSFALEASGKGDKEINDIVPYVLEIVGLSDKMQAFPRQLSGGQKQKVAIARAIANDPKILIADEPTGNLDEEATWDIVEILKKINSWGTTVIMSTHSAEILRSSDQRLIKLEKGKLSVDTKSKRNKTNEEFSDKIVLSTEENKKNKEKKNKEKKQKKQEVDPLNTIEIGEEFVDTAEGDKQDQNKRIQTQTEETKQKEIANDATKEETGVKEKSDQKEKKKINLKIGLSKKKDQEKEVAKKTPDFSDTTLSQDAILLLQSNNYKTLQDVIDSGLEKIKLIDGISGDNIFEIESAIEEYLK